MPKHSKAKAKCTCLNDIFVDRGEGTATNCVAGCTKAPCIYITHFPCNIYGPQNELIAHPCLVNKKNCVDAGAASLPEIWSSRWGGGAENPALDQPAIRMSECPDTQVGSCDFCPDVDCFLLHVESMVICATCEATSCFTYATPGTPIDLVLHRTGSCTWSGCYDVNAFDNICSAESIIGDSVFFRLVATSATDWNLYVDVDWGVGCIGNDCIDLQTNIGEVDCNGTTSFDVQQPGSGSYLYACHYTGTLTPTTCDDTAGPQVASSCCHWGDYDLYWEGTSRKTPDNCYDSSGSGTGTGATPCFIKWELERQSATTGEYRLTTRTGETVVYSSTAFNCYGRSDFQMTQASPNIFGLPGCICIEGYRTTHDDNSCAETTGTGSPTESAEQECDCCLDFDCGLPAYVSICGADPIKLNMVWSRTTSPTLPCGVTAPDSVCGFFYDEVECPSEGSLYFVVYCVGSATWAIDVYCLEDECYVLQTSSLSSQSCECAGIYFTINFTFDGDCPCCGCSPCDCTLIPDTLNIDWTSSSNGTGSGTLTRVGETCEWTGTIVTTTADVLDFTMELTTACQLYLSCNGSGLNASFPILQINACDPFDALGTFNGIITGCGSGILDTGSATITE